MSGLALGRGKTRSGYRKDIEGLRAVAVLLVMVAHAGVTFLSGGFVGVDVFFVISGFLITSLLLGEIGRNGRISLLGFYGRRAKRLLPAAGVVLASTALITYLFLPATRWRGLNWNIVASASYWINWRLAAESVNYLNADAPPSMVQHFWSLAVEEQFYLIWPLLLIVVTVIAHRRRRGDATESARPTFYLISIALIGIPSLLWSIHLTKVDSAQAYFVTTTRLWELAVGATVAILVGAFARLRKALAATLAWVGLGMIVASGFIITTATPFPGSVALVPTLGAALVIAGGTAAGSAGPGLLLGLRPMRAVGAISYSLYLWHWPLLVAAEARFGTLSVPIRLGVVGLAFIPAALTYRFIENPIRISPALTSRPVRALRLGLAFTLVPVVGAFAFQTTYSQLHKPPVRLALGAAVLGKTPLNNPKGVPVDHVAWMTPQPGAALDDLPVVYNHPACVLVGDQAVPPNCVYGDTTSKFTVALVGDSHAAEWFPALDAVAKSHHWRLVTYLKAACPYDDVDVMLRTDVFAACHQWNATVRAKLTGPDRPNLVITSMSLGYVYVGNGKPLDYGTAASAAAQQAGMTGAWSNLVAAGNDVVVIRDSPQPEFLVPDCVASNLNNLTKCTFPQKRMLADSALEVKVASSTPGVHLVDLNSAICPTARCASVIGNVLVYQDKGHMTATYEKSLTPYLDAALSPLVASGPNP